MIGLIVTQCESLTGEFDPVDSEEGGARLVFGCGGR